MSALPDVSKGMEIIEVGSRSESHRESSKHKLFFPKNNVERSKPLGDLPLLQLRYLASMAEDPQKSPFTKSQAIVLANADSKNRTTVWSLRLGLVASIVTMLALSYLGLTISSTIPLAVQAGIFTGAAIANAALVSLSFWATGFAPDNSSNAFNDKQDALHAIADTYNNVAHRLITLYFSAENQEATIMAKKIDIARLKSLIAQGTHGPVQAELIINQLREAIDYINSKGTMQPDTIYFRVFIRNEKLQAKLNDKNPSEESETLSGTDA